MGVSVSDTNAEATIATVTTTANSLKMRPMMPPISRTGMNTATSETVIDMMVKPISRLPFERGLEWRETFLLHVPIDVLQHDDGIVDHQAYRQGQAEQRDIVDAEIEQIHRPERGDQRDRNRKSWNDGGGDPPQEQEDHHDDERDRQQQGELHIVDGIANGDGAVVENV